MLTIFDRRRGGIDNVDGLDFTAAFEGIRAHVAAVMLLQAR